MIDVWVDGGYGSKGVSIGVVINEGPHRIYTLGVKEKMEGSNNVAEYLALNVSLAWLMKRGHHHKKITIRSDSKMLVQQINDRMAVRNGDYVEQYLKARETVKQFNNLSVIWIPREENKEADALTRV
ncbi:MAG: ribonuclease HI family protein [Chitinophagales bacterium]|nr:ribonuclease HI family protein [Chitinophagales bacterium]